MEHGSPRTPLHAPPAGPNGLPAEFAALESAARAAMVAAHAAERWDAAARARALAVLESVARVNAVTRGEVVTAESRAGTWSLAGDRDIAGFLGRTSRQGRGAGYAVAGEAATLSAMPAVADALVDGPVTIKHVQEITRATAASPALAQQLGTREGQERLVGLARRLNGQEFGRALKAMGAQIDPSRRQREHDEQRAERYLNISHGPGGTTIKGLVDSVTGHRFAKAIEAHNPRPAADDHGSAAQRRADALGSMVENVLRDPVTTPGSVAPAQVILTIGEDTWAALRAAQTGSEPAPLGPGAAAAGKAASARGAASAGGNGSGIAGGAGGGPGSGSTSVLVAALCGTSPVVDESGDAWPAGEVARALCECELTRVVVGAEKQVLDMGRSVRLFDRRIFKALLAAGWRTCAWPGCTMPLRWSQLHHLEWWSRGGPTTWANAGPYCCFHHQYIHDHDIAIRRIGNAYEHRRRGGALIGTTHPDGSVDYPDAPPEVPDAPPDMPEVPPEPRPATRDPVCGEPAQLLFSG